MAITYRGEKFSGYNKPKRTPKHPSKSHAVLAKEGGKVKLIRFGQQGVSGAGKNPRVLKKRQEENLLKQDTLKILKKEKCQQPIGLIKQNGKKYSLYCT